MSESPSGKKRKKNDQDANGTDWEDDPSDPGFEFEGNTDDLEPPKVEIFLNEAENEDEKSKITLPNGFDIDNKMIEDIVKQILKQFPIDELSQIFSSKPKIMGFQMRIDPEGDKHIKKLPDAFGFNEIRKMIEEQTGLGDQQATVKIDPEAETSLQPDADLIEEADAYYLTIDLPGVERKDMKLSVSDHKVRVFARRGEQTFKKAYRLDAVVDRKHVKAKFRNGILDVRLPKLEPDIDLDSEIEIE